jgi:hypothetical protein
MGRISVHLWRICLPLVPELPSSLRKFLQLDQWPSREHNLGTILARA